MTEASTAASEHGQHALTSLRFHAFGYDYLIWPSELVGLVMFVGCIWAFWHAHSNKKNPINLGEMFVWPGTKHTSLAMVMAFLGSVTSIWVIIDQELKGRLTEGIFIAFLGILVLGKTGTEAVNAWRAKPSAPPAPPPAPPPVTVTQQNQAPSS